MSVKLSGILVLVNSIRNIQLHSPTLNQAPKAGGVAETSRKVLHPRIIANADMLFINIWITLRVFVNQQEIDFWGKPWT